MVNRGPTRLGASALSFLRGDHQEAVVKTETPIFHGHEAVHARRIAHITRSLVVQFTALVFLVSILLWTMLFTGYGPVHDSLHALRHSLFLIPCH